MDTSQLYTMLSDLLDEIRDLSIDLENKEYNLTRDFAHDSGYEAGQYDAGEDLSEIFQKYYMKLEKLKDTV